MGSANVRRIIERHGGKVSAQGQRDEGATFTVTLPTAVKSTNTQTEGR